ncbi:hypothetical protein FOZ60_005734 [Perkinsus olseni]|uniref:Myb-like domain-containing protein n=1 Tax=Perkinsus olseni TaxID=32597 RepID=A0A7J6NQV2_PEROL|nr:hypothetical protein FOZ60_005734 [Perkinsus olseni]
MFSPHDRCSSEPLSEPSVARSRDSVSRWSDDGGPRPVGSESSTSSSTWSFPSSSTSLSSSFSREELGDTEGHLFGWVPRPRLFEDQHLNGDGMKEGPWAWVEEDDLRRAHRRYGNNWSKLIRSSRYRGYAFSGRSYSAIACKWDRMKTRRRMEKLREKRRVQRRCSSSRMGMEIG